MTGGAKPAPATVDLSVPLHDQAAIVVGNQLRQASNRFDELLALRQYRPMWSVFDEIMDDLDRLGGEHPLGFTLPPQPPARVIITGRRSMSFEPLARRA